MSEIRKVTDRGREIVFYRPNKKYELLDYLKENAYAVISRINPGNLKEVDEYFQFLKALANFGVEVHTHPDVIFVGCRYLERISEGEVRVLLVNDKAVSVVHKKPQEGEFSATLFSGAKYKYESPEDPKWKDVIKITTSGLKDLKPYLSGQSYPLLWTMDYIMDYDKDGKDTYVLSEINCSCVGITTELQYAKDIAKVFKPKKEKK